MPQPENSNRSALQRSLIYSIGIVSVVYILCAAGVLPAAFPADFAAQPAVHALLHIAVFIPLALGMSWVGIVVESPVWRVLVCLIAVVQIPLAARIAALYELEFSAGSPVLCVLMAWLLPEWIRLLETQNLPPQPGAQGSFWISGEHAPMAPERVDCSVLHCELLNLSQVTENLPPEACATYLSRLQGILHESTSVRGGRSDRSDSEAFRAIFAPTEHGEAHSHAVVHAAFASRARAAALSQECEARYGVELDVRFGVSSGELLLANFGADGISKFGAAGETAEWARRLAGANLLYGTRILLSERTIELTESFVETRPIDLLQRHLPPHPPEDVGELLALAGTMDADAQNWLSLYRQGVFHFRNRHWKAARTALRSARPAGHTDDSIELLLQRINEQESLAQYSKTDSSQEAGHAG